jgi:hypothetical protein
MIHVILKLGIETVTENGQLVYCTVYTVHTKIRWYSFFMTGIRIDACM